MERLPKWGFCFCAVIILIGAAPATAEQKPHVINEYHHDVTGDGKQETIVLYGEMFKESDVYYEKIWAEIESVGSIEYGSGYEPRIEFADLNHDGTDDLLFSSPTGGSGGITNYALHTAKGGKITEIPLPEPQLIEGHFENGFKAVIQIPGIRKPIRLNLSDRKADYIRLGLYQKNGLLNEATELMIDPVALYEVIPGKKGVRLKGYRQISGAYHADRIGTVETVWSMDKDGTWQPVSVKWVKSDKKRKPLYELPPVK